MAVAYQQSVILEGGSTTRSPSFTLGTAPEEDDVIFLFVNATAVTATTDVSGWTNMLGANVEVASDAHAVNCHSHVVTSGEAGSSTVTWTLTNLFNTTGQNHALLAAVYRGVNTSAPFDDIDTYAVDEPTTDALVPALTPTVTGGKVIAFVANDSGVAGNATPSGWTSRNEATGSGAHFELFEWNTDTTATVATDNPTVVGASDEKIVVALVVAPEVATTVAAGWGVVA